MNLIENWWEEKRSAYLYEIMAANETNILHQKLFQDLEKAALAQAAIWEAKIKASGESLPPFKLDLRTKIVVQMIRFFGTDNIHSILSAMKIRGMSLFNNFHSEHRHTTLSSASNLRAAIFGINDGLISNMSLILGIVGATQEPHFIILAGVAGLLAGACSMGAGEYISVKSQKEVFEYQIELEKKELEEYPEEETEELKLIYEARGIPTEQASQLAKLMIANPKTALDTLAREELGLNPQDLVSPMGAMLSSFFSFAIGACIPILPFLLNHGTHSIYLSVGVTGLALFIVGMLLSLYTNKNAFVSGLRMLSIGALAGLVTFGIGRLLGVSLG